MEGSTFNAISAAACSYTNKQDMELLYRYVCLIFVSGCTGKAQIL
jgi:hypothetical protein